MLLQRLSPPVAAYHLCVPDSVICRRVCFCSCRISLSLISLISLTQTLLIQYTQYHSRKYRPSSQTLISSHTQTTHSIHSTHLTHFSFPHTRISSHSMSFAFTSIHLYHSVQSPTHTLPSTLADSFLDSHFGKTSSVGLSGPLITPNVGSN